MEEILKVNKNDSIARQMLNNMIKKEKEYKDREEKKLRNQQRQHVKQFKKMLRKKNSTNDLKYFKDHLSTDEQTAVLKELEHLNKLTITDKPYRLALSCYKIPRLSYIPSSLHEYISAMLTKFSQEFQYSHAHLSYLANTSLLLFGR